MSKRYRLVIPEMINKKDAAIAKAFRENDGVEIPLGYEIMKSHTMNGIPFNNIPRDWLEEIKEPETFDGYMSHRFGEDWRDLRYNSSDMANLDAWTVENERKKHEPKQSFSEVLETGKLSEFCQCGHCSDAYAQGWDACEENRGYNE